MSHASLFHGTINALAGIGALMLSTRDWTGRGVVGLGGFAALAMTAAGVGAERWRRRA